MLVIRFLLPLLTIMLLGCQRPGRGKQIVTTEPISVPARVVFLAFRAQATAKQPAVFTLLHSTPASGAAKFFGSNIPQHTYLSISLLDKQQQVLTSTRIEHPLLPVAEYVSDNGQLGRQAVVLPEAEFFVRLPLPQQAARIQLEEIVADSMRTRSFYPLPVYP